MKISRQWLFVMIWSAMIVLIANIPYIYGYAIAPAGRIFMGDARCFIDTNTYIAWMHQALDGHFLFKDIYTSEPHSRIFFHPLFLMLGNIARLTGLSVFSVHGISRVLFGFLLLLFCYKFVCYFVEGDFERSAAFIMISISGGFGWLTLFEGINKISESWFLTGWIEGNTFLSLYALPLFSLSLLMLLATILLILKAFEEDRMDYSAYAGLICLFLIFTHFFDALVVYPVLITYILARYFVSRALPEVWKETKHFGILFLLSCPAALYDLWASMVNPVFHEHAWKGAVTLSPALIWYIGGLGFVGVFAAVGAILVLFDTKQADTMFWRRAFLAVWLLTVPFLIYLPISFQRRLVEGVHVPAAILATLGFLWLIKRFNLDAKIFMTVLILAVIPNSLYVLHKDMAYLKQNSTTRSLAGFLDQKIYEGMEWLEKNTNRDDIIFCDYETGNYLPAVSGNTVFIGHSPQTIDFERKWAASRAFFNEAANDDLRIRILRSSGAKYIFYGFKEASLGRFNPSSSPYLKQVFNNGEAAIFEVRF